MTCSHCGAENSDSSVRCRKCALRSSIASLGQMIRATLLLRLGSFTAPMIAKRGCTKNGGDRPSGSLSSNQRGQSMPSPIPAACRQNPTASHQNRALVVCVMLAIAVSGSAAIWHAVVRNSPVVGPSRKGSIPIASRLTVPMTVAMSSPPVSGWVHVTTTVKPVEAGVTSESVALDRIPVAGAVAKVQDNRREAETRKIRRIPVMKRRVRHGKPSVSKSVGAPPTKEHIRLRETATQPYQDESSRAARAKIAQQTPQQACADRSNFISRGICEARECEKPDRINLKFCSDMRARRAPRDYPN